jgi:hypothetical protein
MNISWIDSLRRVTRGLNPFLSALILGVGVYFIASLPLFFTGQWRLAISLPLWLGTTGIVWSLLFYWLGSDNYGASIDLVKQALAEKEHEDFETIKSAHLNRIKNHSIYFPAALAIWVFSMILVIGDMHHSPFTHLPKPSGVLGAEWHQMDSPWSRIWAIAIFGVPITLLIVTLGLQIILHTVFLRRITKLQFVESQHIAFVRLRPLLRVNILAAFGWSIGIALFGILFKSKYTAVTAGSYLFLGLLGTIPMIAFFPPILMLHEKLKDLGLNRLSVLEKGALDNLKLVGGRKFCEDAEGWQKVFTLEEQISKQATDQLFAIGWRYVAYIVSAFIIPIVTAVIATVITNSIASQPK